MNHHVRSFEPLLGYIREKEAMGLIERGGLFNHAGVPNEDLECFIVIHRILLPTWEKIIEPGIKAIVHTRDIRCEPANEHPFIHAFFYARPR